MYMCSISTKDTAIHYDTCVPDEDIDDVGDACNCIDKDDVLSMVMQSLCSIAIAYRQAQQQHIKR